MFSSRVPAQLGPNAPARAVGRARAQGRTLIDLTVTNPTRAGISYPPGHLSALAADEAATYDPQPFGLRRARETVAAEYGRLGLEVPWEHVVLTASTSDAYSLLFKLLCAPCGDEVIAPVPSYPLFEHLTRLDGVGVRPYRLEYSGRWAVDFDSVDRQWTNATRAALAVSPNNPTGSVLAEDELDGLARRCASRDAALILDEVFADYPVGRPAPPRSPASPGRPSLTFRLGGLSKSVALPQVKLGWIVVEGPPPLVEAALMRLELICDTYLSVSTPVQAALPALMTGGVRVRREVQARIEANYGVLRQFAGGHASIDVLPVDAGWSAVLRIPAREPEEQTAVRLVEEASVIVHPGYFFDFPQEAFLVVSLLPEPASFREGVRRVLEHVDV